MFNKDFIIVNKEVRNGTPVFKGTRVPVYFVLEHIALGWSVKKLKKIFPTVKSEYISDLINDLAKDFKVPHVA